MKTLLSIFVLFAAFCSLAQPVPRPVAFAWDAPTDISDVIGYEFQWGPQDTAQLPLYQTVYAVPNFPLDFNRRVAVSSISSMTNSDPAELNIFNLLAHVEESTDGQAWTTLQTLPLTGERQPRSLLRVRLDTK